MQFNGLHTYRGMLMRRMRERKQDVALEDAINANVVIYIAIVILY